MGGQQVKRYGHAASIQTVQTREFSEGQTVFFCIAQAITGVEGTAVGGDNFARERNASQTKGYGHIGVGLQGHTGGYSDIAHHGGLAHGQLGQRGDVDNEVRIQARHRELKLTFLRHTQCAQGRVKAFV